MGLRPNGVSSNPNAIEGRSTHLSLPRTRNRDRCDLLEIMFASDNKYYHHRRTGQHPFVGSNRVLPEWRTQIVCHAAPPGRKNNNELLQSLFFDGRRVVPDERLLCYPTRNVSQHIFIHNGPRGSHDTSDIKLVGLQLVRYSYFVSDATLARQADRFVVNIISWCRPSTSQSLNRLPSG